MSPADPAGRSFGSLTTDTSRSGLPAGVFAKQEILVTGSPTGGNFTLSFGGTSEVDTLTPSETFTGGSFVFSFVALGVQYTTGPVMFNASNAELKAALEAARGPIGQTLPASAVAVTNGPVASAATTLTWLSSLGPVTELKVVEESPVPAGAKLNVARTTPGTLVTTGNLPAAATAAEVQTALRGLSTIGGTNCTVAGSAGGPYVVTFAGERTGPQPLIIGNGAGLTYGSQYTESRIVVETVQGGVASTEANATGHSTAFNANDIAAIEAEAVATTVEGTTPKLTLSLQGSDDGTNWFAVDTAFQEITAANQAQKETFEVAAWGQLRWSWTVSGTTPKFVLVINTAVKLTGNA